MKHERKRCFFDDVEIRNKMEWWSLREKDYFCPEREKVNSQSKKISSQWYNFQNLCLNSHRQLRKTDDIEESDKALTRLWIWKILCVRGKSLKAVPPAVVIYCHLPMGVGLHIYLQVWADFHSYVHRYSRTFRQRMSRRLTLYRKSRAYSSSKLIFYLT